MGEVLPQAGTARKTALGELFRPQSVAVVGASTRGGWPDFPRALQAMGYRGPIYPVNPRATEIAGLRCYPELTAIDGAVDYVISCVPAPAVPEVLEQCIAKGARLLHLFTAGFAETGHGERAAMERGVIERAVQAGMRVLGPNCMGLYAPRAGMAFAPGSPAEPGDIGMISQSGGHAGDFIHHGALQGLRFSQVISYGNGADISATELLEYLADDPETQVIGVYIEGVGDGAVFLRALRAAASRKPVVVLKGGRTEAGGRAARSHTGSLAGSLAVFDAACRQAGAVRAATMEEMIDLVTALRLLGAGRGRRVGLVMDGGGAGVLATDALVEAGFSVPPLPAAAREALSAYVPIAGASTANPVDVNLTGETGALTPILEIVGGCDEVDLLCFQVNFNWRDEERREAVARELTSQLAEGRARSGKPLAVVVDPGRDLAAIGAQLRFTRLCTERGLPVFTSSQRAARALAAAITWHAGR